MHRQLWQVASNKHVLHRVFEKKANDNKSPKENRQTRRDQAASTTDKRNEKNERTERKSTKKNSQHERNKIFINGRNTATKIITLR